jgi:DUF1680 family protein
MSTGTVRPSPTALSRLRPVGFAQVNIVDGFFAGRQTTNRERTIPHGFARLQDSGPLNNLKLAAARGSAAGKYQALSDTGGFTFPFLDSDVYKWLEAVGWELGRAGDPDLKAMAEEAIGAVAAAQRPDGYLNSYVQVVKGGTPFQDLQWGHEFYCLGHLLQAAVAWHRALGDDRLLTIATRAVDHIYKEFGPDGRDGIDGHPGIEMALVELYRITGERRYLTFAARMLDLRGHGLLGNGRFGPEYWQDHAPVRTAPTVAGHAVRQLYLDCGLVDVAVELGDDNLLAAAERRWWDLMRTRTYLTGAMGSRHRDEAFGDPYELPPDRAYAETCAAIASIMLAWRLLLATGNPRYADAIERAIYNAVLPAISRSGTAFFYVNPLQRRTHRAAEAPGHGERAPWYPCACCPPNLMRLLSSWGQYLTTADDGGVQIHQYASADIDTDVAGDPVRLSVRTDYPWQGRVTVHIEQSPERPWTLVLRVPGWCRSAKLTLPGSADPLAVGPGTAEQTRQWSAGDTVVLDLDLPVRVTRPEPRVDAVRGCVAIERGPLVYCVETADLPPGVELEDIRFDGRREPSTVARADLGDAVVGVKVPIVVPATSGRSAAEPAVKRPDPEGTDGPADNTTMDAVPYFAWGNRRVEAMRVWIPTT